MAKKKTEIAATKDNTHIVCFRISDEERSRLVKAGIGKRTRLGRVYTVNMTAREAMSIGLAVLLKGK